MKDVTLVCISDIHFATNDITNRGVVYDGFFKDLESKFKRCSKENVFCVISGDLVQAGASKEAFENFYDQFIEKLSIIIPIDHILVTAGNHDLNRQIFSSPKEQSCHRELVHFDGTEDDCNNELKKEDSQIWKKFHYYDEFCKEKLHISNFNLFGYATNIVPEISIFCLNSSLLSTGGYDGLDKDISNLRIETSRLYEWAMNDDGRCKILVMHHPMHHLTEYVQHVLRTILDKHVQLLITGHLHDQDYRKYIGIGGELCHYCSSPQLFSDKNETNGYSIIHFHNNEIDNIEYRQWSSHRDVFVGGNTFTGTDDGIIKIGKQYYTRNDIISEELEESLRDSLQIYNYAPTWVERRLSNLPIHPLNAEQDEKSYDYLDVINLDGNVQIVGGTQFGLTTLAHKLVYEAWRLKRQHWLYLDVKDTRVNDIEHQISNFLRKRGIGIEAINTIIVDNWGRSKNEKSIIYNRIRSKYENSRIILIHNEEDTTFFSGIDDEFVYKGFAVLYLRELGRKSIRHLTEEFLKANKLDDAEHYDKVMEHLLVELSALNIHQTPVNCLQLLMNFKQNYDIRPADKSRILSTLIKILFLNPSSFFYTSKADELDCYKYMGALCEYLFEKADEGKDSMHYLRFFTKEDFDRECKTRIDNYSYAIGEQLFQAMLDAKIIIPYLSYYEFRFNYWQYFFTAYQMHISDNFYNYMIENRKCIYLPEVMEYYTGINPKCDHLIHILTLELDTLSSEIIQNIGLQTNPYEGLRIRINRVAQTQTSEELSKAIRESRVPEDVKDAIMDKRSTPERPYYQGIDRYFEQLKIHNLMQLTRSASRAFRNSELISEEERKSLYISIQRSWMAITKVLLLITPSLTETGQGQIGGARFCLADDFPAVNKEIHILVSYPFNIIMWFKNDVYSDKRVKVYKYFIDNKNGMDYEHLIQYMNVMLYIFMKPQGWGEVVSNYVQTQSPNSFYTNDIYSVLRYTYQYDAMAQDDLRRSEKLIIDLHKKMNNNYQILPDYAHYMNQKQSKVNLLPKRKIED